MATYHYLFMARFGVKPDIDGRDGKILSDLIKRHGAEEVTGLLKFFFDHPPAWVEKRGKFTIPTFKGLYNELLALSLDPKTTMRAF